jgi:RNA polymerase sigma-70 factor (ECF subfamily)
LGQIRGQAGAQRDLALETFAVTHYPRLIRLAGLICRDAQQAQDAVQAGLERAWRRRSQLQDVDRLPPWLDRIVVREAIRASRAGLFGFGRPPQVREIDVDQDDGAKPGLMDDMADLKVAFERLSSAHRAVVALHLYAGYSVAETAEIVGAPLETVRSRLRVARDSLRTSLGAER